MNDSPAVEALRHYARSRSKRLRRCNDYNPNAGECAYWGVSFRDRGRRVQLQASASMLSLSIGVESSIIFSVNKPDRVCLMDQPLPREPGYPNATVFVRFDLGYDAVLEWLKQPRNIKVLDDCGLSDRESLQVYGNAVHLVFEPNRSVEDALDRLAALIECLPEDRVDVPNGCFLVDDLILDPSKLPPDLRGLVPFIRKWAIADDADRQEKLRKARIKTRKELVRAVRPHMGRINDLLDSFGDEPLPDEIVLLGHLAEAVSELPD